MGVRGDRIDEPMVWGKLPISTFWQPRNVRWTLGASDIMFTTPSVLITRIRCDA